MQKRTLGNTGLQVSALVMGCNVLGWTVTRQKAFDLLDACLDRGLNTFDTADMYSSWAPGNEGGESESIIGQWLRQKGCRDKVIICTKVGMWTKMPGLSAKNIEAAVEQSLQRLGTDYIDIYYAHQEDPQTPQEETLQAFDKLVKAGKVRILGASNHSCEKMRQALEISRSRQLAAYQVIQPLYNLYDRQGFEQELAGFARSQGLGVMNYYSLASGFLSAKYTSLDQIKGKARERTLGKYFTQRGLRILDALQEVSAKTGASGAQIALAWLLQKPAVTAPIVSATSIEQLDDLLGCFKVGLDPDLMQLLDQASQEQ